MTVATLRARLDEWGAKHGASLKLGEELPSSWLAPLAHSDADPVEGKGSEADDDDAGEGDDDDEFGGDEWGAETGNTEGSGGRTRKTEVLIGKGRERVRGGISMETFIQAVGHFALKTAEMRAQLFHARQTKLFSDFANNQGEFKELFDQLDTNHEGYIDRAELDAGMVRSGFKWMLPLP